MNSRNQARILLVFTAAILAVGVTHAVNRILQINGQLVAVLNETHGNDLSPNNGFDFDRKNISLDKFRPLFDKRLQGKPLEPKPIKPEKVVIQNPKPPVATKRPQVVLPDLQLTGILHSNKFSLATFLIGGKSISLGVGEEFNGIQLEKIEPDRVTLSYRETQFERGIQ